MKIIQLNRLLQIAVLLFLSAFAGSNYCWGDTTATGRLIVIGCPDSAVVSADGKQIEHDIGGWYTVPAGNVQIQIHIGDSLLFQTTMNFKKNEDSRVIFGCRIECSRLTINTVPPGALLSIDNEPYGSTPFVNSFVKPGNRALNLTLRGYAPMNHSISVSSGKLNNLNLVLERSKAYKDSVKQISLQKKRSRQLVQKLMFGALSAGLAGAGIYFDMTASKALLRAEDAATAYDGASGKFTVYRGAYYDNREDAKELIESRNILLGAAGVSLLGFGLSFVF